MLCLVNRARSARGLEPSRALRREHRLGSGGYATPRTIFEMWMHSPGHRENILGPYRDTGLGLKLGTLEGFRGAHVWTEEFGSRAC